MEALTAPIILSILCRGDALLRGQRAKSLQLLLSLEISAVHVPKDLLGLHKLTPHAVNTCGVLLVLRGGLFLQMDKCGTLLRVQLIYLACLLSKQTGLPSRFMLEMSNSHGRVGFFVGHALQLTLCCSKHHCGLGLLVHHALHLHVLPNGPLCKLALPDSCQASRGMRLGLQLLHRGMFSLLHAIQPMLRLCDLLSQSLLRRSRDGLPPCDRGRLLPLCESGRSACAIRWCRGVSATSRAW